MNQTIVKLLKLSGDNSECDPPDPIPNSEVKPLHADDSALRESRSSPDFCFFPVQVAGFFLPEFFLHRKFRTYSAARYSFFINSIQEVKVLRRNLLVCLSFSFYVVLNYKFCSWFVYFLAFG